MAKQSKQAQAELDAAIDQLGGGAIPLERPVRPPRRRVTKPTVKKKTSAKKTAKMSAAKRKRK